MLTNNSIKISQVGLSIFALFALILVSGATITLLNPIVEDSSSNLNSGQVAGLSTVNTQALSVNLSLNSSLNSKFSTHLVNSHSEGENVLGTIIVSSLDLSKGSYNEALVNLYNPNNLATKTKVSFFIPEELKGKLKVYLEDAKDSLIMYTIDQSYGPKTITLPELSERNFQLRVEASEDINTPIELVFVFTVGQ